MLSPGPTTFVAYETITAGCRVKLRSDGQIALAGIADKEIGTALLHSGKSSYAAGDGVGVALVNHPGTVTCVASEAITRGAVVKRAANGKIAVTGGGDNFGIAFAAADADGNTVEVLRDPTVQTTVSDAAVTSAKLADAVADQIFYTTVAIANTGTPDGVAHITGQVKDAQGNSLSGRFMVNVFTASTAYGAPSAQSGTAAALANSRILVADVANALLQVLTHSDGSWGVEVTTAAGGETIYAHAAVAGAFATANAAITGN